MYSYEIKHPSASFVNIQLKRGYFVPKTEFGSTINIMFRIKYLILGLFLIIAGAKLFFVSQPSAPSVQEILPEIIEVADESAPTPAPVPVIIPEAKKEISAPPPLRLIEPELPPKPAPRITLNQQTVIAWTNIQRVKSGLEIFKENRQLDAMAEAKVEDMFKNQYFAHESPLGRGAGDLAKDFGYEFLAVGENLALGNFASDEALVEAWMASIGHRANILNKAYEEIGVAVGEGQFEGKTVWLAVQHFGRPLSSCAYPSRDLEKEINKNQAHMAELRKILSALEEEIESMEPKSGEAYRKKAEQYNAVASEYNFFVEKTKSMADLYNSQVDGFNVCVRGE